MKDRKRKVHTEWVGLSIYSLTCPTALPPPRLKSEATARAASPLAALALRIEQQTDDDGGGGGHE